MNWLFESWHLLIPKPWAPVVLSIVAVLSGGWVGNERERRAKPAGLRTMALVALGSCTFTMVGYAFTSNTGDSGRVAAQIVTGIGFLGAGVLIRGSGEVHGTTTAATIWVVAAIGMAIGAGYAVAGAGLAFLVRGVLSLVGRWEVSQYGSRYEAVVTLVFDSHHGKTAIKIERLLNEFGITPTAVPRTDEAEGRERWVIKLRLAGRHARELLFELAQMPEIYAIER
jgi:putative Mg2+ transporter-C (MgtC) family protein